MRELPVPRSGRTVAAAVAELERQATERQKRTPSVKTQTPQDNFDSDTDSDGIVTGENERNRKSGSPLTRSESLGKKLTGVESPRTGSKGNSVYFC